MPNGVWFQKTFVPTDVSGIIAWWDFSDATQLFTDAGTTQVTADGDAIYRVGDKSGNNYYLEQTTLSKRPTYKTGIQNNLSVGRFNQTTNVLSSTDAGLLGNFGGADKPFSAFLTFKSAAQHTTQQSVFTIYSDASHYDRLIRYANLDYETHTRYDGTTDVYSDAVTFTGNTFGLHTLIFRAITIDVRLDRTAVLSGADHDTGTLGALTTFAVGDFPASTPKFLDGDICEMVFYNSAITNPNLASIESYLQAKWATP